MSTCKEPANNKKDNIPPIRVTLKSILLTNVYENLIIDGKKYPETNIIKDKNRDKSIRPIVIGIFRNLKFTYINPAEIVTNSDDISNIFNIILQNHQSQSYRLRLQGHAACRSQHYSS